MGWSRNNTRLTTQHNTIQRETCNNSSTHDDWDWQRRSTTMDSLISINQAAGPLGALIEWLCVVVERLAGDGGRWGTDNGLQRNHKRWTPVERWKRGGRWGLRREQQGKMSKRGGKGKDSWMRREAPLCLPPTPIFSPFPHWMTSTQTARHHDGHSPPLMSPSHSWTHCCALQHQQRGLPPWKTDCLLQSQTPQQIHRVKWGPPAVYLQYNYVCLCLWRCVRTVFSASRHCRRPGHLLRVHSTHSPSLAFASLPPVLSSFPSEVGQEPTPCSGISHRQAPLAPGRGKKKKNMYHGAFTHISHSLNPFSNLLMCVTWQYQRRLVR